MLSDVELCCVLIAVGESVKKSIKKKKQKKTRKWAKQWFLDREKYIHEILLNELRICEPNDFRNFLRMNGELFDELLALVTPQIEKKNTIMRDAIPWISSGQKTMVVNLYKDLKSKDPDMPYKQMMSKISETLGIGLNSVRKIISEYKSTETVASPTKTRNKKCLFDKIDDLDRNALRQKVHSFWLKKELPTIDKILEAVNDDPALPNFKRTTLYTTIKKLDFVFTKRKRCSVLTEREDLLVWRQNYLYDVRKFREEGRAIYYLDETWVNAGDCVDKLWVDKSIKSKHDAFTRGLTTGAANPTGKGQRLIVLHIGSNRGFLEGGLLCFLSKKNSSDYHDEMNGDNFHEWFESIIPRLEPNSVIVMDNAPYHSVRAEKIPTSASKRDEILSWLLSKGVVIDTILYKPQLMAKVREIKGQYISYVVDNMAKNAGHTVGETGYDCNIFHKIIYFFQDLSYFSLVTLLIIEIT
ncbi:hypothetical protein QTP88_015973 [Uroleucon formosanum]